MRRHASRVRPSGGDRCVVPERGTQPRCQGRRVTWCNMPGATTKRRVRWTLGILALPLVYAVNVALVVIFDGAYSGERTWPVVVYLAVVIAAFVFAIGLLGRTVKEILLTARLRRRGRMVDDGARSEEHTSELQSRGHLVC